MVSCDGCESFRFQLLGSLPNFDCQMMKSVDPEETTRYPKKDGAGKGRHI